MTSQDPTFKEPPDSNGEEGIKGVFQQWIN